MDLLPVVKITREVTLNRKVTVISACYTRVLWLCITLHTLFYDSSF